MFKKIFWSFLDVMISTIMQFLAIIILSRLLTPKDYGVVGAVSIFIAIGNMLIDSGMGGAIVQKKTVSKEDFSTLFLFNFFISIVLYSIYFLFAQWLESFYSIPGLSSIIRVLALILVISSLGIVQVSCMLRDLKFKQIAIVSFVSCAIGLCVAIYIAINGGGAWALVGQQVSTCTSKTLLYILINRFIPSFSFSFSSFKYQMKFGIGLLLSNIVNSISSNFNSSLIPKITTVTDNGFYVQAVKIESIPSSIITTLSDKALFPLLSNSRNNSSGDFNLGFIMSLIYVLAVPVIFLIAVFSYQIVLIILGESWIMVAHYLLFLVFAGIGTMVQSVSRGILKSLGCTKIIFRITMASSIISISAVLVGSINGIIGILWGVFISSIISGFIYIYAIANVSGYKKSLHLKHLIVPIVHSFVVYVVLKYLLAYFSLTYSLWGFVFVPIGLALYVIQNRCIRNDAFNYLWTFLLKRMKYVFNK